MSERRVNDVGETGGAPYVGKRAVDLLVAISSLIVTAVPMGLIAVAIRLWMGPPVFFRQVRVGRHGRLFRVVKFRTLVNGADSRGAGLYIAENDDRVPPLGGLLRRLSLDELPQLLNVLVGDMSMVGPRPMVPSIVERHSRQYDPILRVRPGITGLAQVNGRESLPRSRRLEIDAEYAQAASLRLDLSILVRTLVVVATGHGYRVSMSPEELER